ncbi:MAG: protein translocase subunit SecD, partial [Ignavibacteriales bacterium]|nr:protein translocase subunit SecD [Ignavibacteriales bacterium]
GDEPAGEPTDVSEEEMTAEEWAAEHPFFSVAMVNPESGTADAYVRESERAKLWRMLERPDVQRVIPNNVEFVLSSDPSFFNEGEAIYTLYLVNKTAELTGGVITEATANLDPTTSAAVVNMEMNSEGATEWARITGANVEKRCAIILDGVVYSAPVIRNKITGGRSQIDGMESLQEARNLAIILNAGAFSAPVEIIEERTVGPSLGQDSISSGFSSALIGFGIVAVFMIFYYQKAGSFAALSLTFTVMFILGVLAGFNATLTLPGIAGIVLTIGMAVDANVLIFERIREEYGAGKTMKASVEGGFRKAYSAIWDSNITTFFTGVILYQFGTGPVQGFALTLMIGIASSLFSALVISKLIFDYMNHKGYKISIG